MLIILTTHPIQYQVPIWRALAARGRVPAKVLYMSDQGVQGGYDPGFSREVKWDLDLLSGYDHEFIDAVRGPVQESFLWLRLGPGFSRRLEAMGAEALWIQGWQVAAYWQAAFAARHAGAELWLRGDTNLRSNAGGRGRPLKRFLLRRLLARADRLLYVGAANREFYVRLGSPMERLASAPHCVDNQRFASMALALAPSRRELRLSFGIAEDAFCFLFIGKLIAKKRPQDLLRALSRLEAAMPGVRTHALFVGTGELGPDLKRASHVTFDAGATGVGGHGERRGRPSASFAGFLNQTEVGRAYVAADCLVLPSDGKETWGLVVNEAMASGLAAIVSDACGCAEDLVVPRWPELCFPLGDIEGLARSMAAVMRRPPSPAELAQHIDGYDCRRTVETVEALYMDLAGRRRRQATGG